MIGRVVLCGAATLLGSPVSARQTAGYRSGALVCGQYIESVRSDLQTTVGKTTRRTRIDRDGVLQVRAEPGPGALTLEVWYDSLALRQESPESVLVVDTEGFLGGRYGGTLSPVGRYDPAAQPFVPDALREVVDLARVIEDFFPRVPDTGVVEGGFAPVEGIPVERLADSAGFTRYRWHRTPRAEPVVTETLVEAGGQVVEEQGVLRWHPAYGPQRWTRHVDVRATLQIPDTKARVTTHLVQEIAVERMARCAGDNKTLVSLPPRSLP